MKASNTFTVCISLPQEAFEQLRELKRIMKKPYISHIVCKAVELYYALVTSGSIRSIGKYRMKLKDGGYINCRSNKKRHSMIKCVSVQEETIEFLNELCIKENSKVSNIVCRAISLLYYVVKQRRR